MAEKKVFGNDGPSNPDLPMSTFDKSYTNNFSARVGRAYPCFLDLVPPKSTAHITPHSAFDMMPTTSPIQASIHQHISYYKIPLRILLRSYEDFFSRVGDHKLPYIKRPKGWCETGSLADYMGIPSQDFRSRPLVGSLSFHRRGYISFGSLTGMLFKNVDLDSLFSFNLGVRPSSNSAVLSHHQCNASITEVSHKLFSGVVQLPYVAVPPAETVSNSDFGSNRLYLLAVRCAKGKLFSYTSDSFSYQGAGLNEPTGNWSVVDWVNGSLLHDVTPSGGVSPSSDYSNLDPGQYALVNTPYETISVGGYSYNKYQLAFRMSDAFFTSLNRLIDEAESGQRVFLILGWLSSSAAESHFGSNEPLPGSSTPTLSVGSIQTLADGELQGSEKPVNLYSQQKFVVLYPGIGGGGNVKFAYFDNSEDENPFCSYDGADPKLPVSALSFRAYEFIHNYFFRNERVDPFLKADPATGELVPTYNQFITNDSDGADETTPVDFFNVPYEYDMFTTCQKSPQFGNAPLVGISTNDDSNTAEILMTGTDESGQTVNFTIAVDLDSAASGKIVQISNYDEVADKPSVMRLNEAIKYGISINDFRSVNAFQIMNERFLKAGYCYPDLVQEFFGTRPPVGENYPEYLGGVTRTVNISKIQNVAKSESAALGEFAGTGSVEAHGERVECFCSEWSFIMGICWFSVTPIYSQKIDKFHLYSHYLDFYNPALMSIGPQPVFKYQLSPLQLPKNEDGTIDIEHLADVFGYNRPWADMVSKQDEAHGEFRSTLHSYLLQRLFATAPELGVEFLYIDSKDLTDIYSYIADTDKFFGAILHEYYLKMPMPKVSLPRII